MYGTITKFRKDVGVGIIKTDNGQKFRFAKADITNASDHLEGHDVDFVLVSRRPAAIIMMTGSPWTAFGEAGRA
jgi:hypothetical protein